jgi:hypothetical protein
MSGGWCGAYLLLQDAIVPYTDGEERVTLQCHRAEHQDGELHWDKDQQAFWLGASEAPDYERIYVTELDTEPPK